MPKARSLAKRGRPRKPNVSRFPSGQIRAENPEAVMDTVLNARKRHHSARDVVLREAGGGKVSIAASDPLWGSALGRLRSAGGETGITRDQFDAASAWGDLYARYCHMMGFSSPNAKSVALIGAMGGMSCAPEPTDDEIAHTRAKWAEAYIALDQRAVDHGTPTPYGMLVRVVVEDRDPTGHRELGNLRIACNELLRIQRRAKGA